MDEPDTETLKWNSVGLLPKNTPLITIGRDNGSIGRSLHVQRPPRYFEPTLKGSKVKEGIRRGIDDKREIRMIKERDKK